MQQERKPATKVMWEDACIVTQQVSAADLVGCGGDIKSVLKTLQSHYGGRHMPKPCSAVWRGPTSATFDLLSHTTPDVFSILIGCCRDLELDQASQLYVDLLRDNVQSLDYSHMLLGQALVAACPAVGVRAADYAAEHCLDSRPLQTHVAVLWYIAQPVSWSTAVALYGWEKYVLSLLLSNSTDPVTMQWAEKYTEVLAALPAVMRPAENECVDLDLIRVLVNAFSDWGLKKDAIQSMYTLYKRVWLEISNENQYRTLFYWAVGQLENEVQGVCTPRTDELVSLAEITLQRIPTLYSDWRNALHTSYRQGKPFIGLLKGSQHFLQYVFEKGRETMMPAEEVEGVLHVMVELSDKHMAKASQLGVGWDTAVKAQLAALYCRDLLARLPSNHISSWLLAAILIGGLALVIPATYSVCQPREDCTQILSNWLCWPENAFF